jgi:uncharacterized protein (DUF58 family)
MFIISFFIISISLIVLAFAIDIEELLVFGLILLGLTFFSSIVVYRPINKTYIDAESVRVGDELIVKVDQHPSVSLKEIKYLDQESQLVVITNQNFWKSERITYEVKIKEKQ